MSANATPTVFVFTLVGPPAAAGVFAILMAMTTGADGVRTHTVHSTTMVTVTSCSAGCTDCAPQVSMTTVTEGAASASMSKVGTASPAPASSSATTPAAPSGSSCPANLQGAYQPREDRAYTLFAQDMERSGFARGE